MLPRLGCAAGLSSCASRCRSLSRVPGPSQPPRRYLSRHAALKAALRQLYRRVHPDLFERHPSARATNEASFKALQSYLSALQPMLDKTPHRATAFDDTYRLSFHVHGEDRAGTDVAEETAASRPSSAPPSRPVSAVLRSPRSVEDAERSLALLFRACGVECPDLGGGGGSESEGRMEGRWGGPGWRASERGPWAAYGWAPSGPPRGPSSHASASFDPRNPSLSRLSPIAIDRFARHGTTSRAQRGGDPLGASRGALRVSLGVRLAVWPVEGTGASSEGSEALKAAARDAKALCAAIDALERTAEALGDEADWEDEEHRSASHAGLRTEGDTSGADGTLEEEEEEEEEERAVRQAHAGWGSTEGHRPPKADPDREAGAPWTAGLQAFLAGMGRAGAAGKATLGGAWHRSADAGTSERALPAGPTPWTRGGATAPRAPRDGEDPSSSIGLSSSSLPSAQPGPASQCGLFRAILTPGTEVVLRAPPALLGVDASTGNVYVPSDVSRAALEALLTDPRAALAARRAHALGSRLARLRARLGAALGAELVDAPREAARDRGFERRLRRLVTEAERVAERGDGPRRRGGAGVGEGCAVRFVPFADGGAAEKRAEGGGDVRGDADGDDAAAADARAFSTASLRQSADGTIQVPFFAAVPPRCSLAGMSGAGEEEDESAQIDEERASAASPGASPRGCSPLLSSLFGLAPGSASRRAALARDKHERATLRRVVERRLRIRRLSAQDGVTPAEERAVCARLLEDAARLQPLLGGLPVEIGKTSAVKENGTVVIGLAYVV